jgi:hypothetical protein
MLNTIEILEAKIRPVLTANLMPMLIEIDKQIEAERAKAAASGNFDKMQAMNTTRTAIINIMDERDPSMFDNYCDAKYAA